MEYLLAKKNGWRLLPLMLPVLLVACGSSDSPTASSEDIEASVERLVFVKAGQIFTSGVRTTHLTPVTDPGQYANPKWSPDGSRIAAISEEMEGNRILILDADGIDIRSTAEFYHHPAILEWAPDGGSLLVLDWYDDQFPIGVIVDTLERDTRSTIYRVDVNTMEREIVAEEEHTRTGIAELPRVEAMEWPRLGGDVLYLLKEDDDYRMRRVSPNGGGVQSVDITSTGLTEVSFSPDGTYAAVIISTDSEAPGELFRVNTASGESRKLTDKAVSFVKAIWSPDGSRLAFASAHSDDGHCYIVDVEGTSLTRVSDSAAAHQLISWSPDGRYIAYTFSTGPTELRILDIEGRSSVSILDQGYEVDLLWSR